VLQFGLSPVALGFVFLVGPGMYAVTAPIWGRIVDKTVGNLAVLTFNRRAFNILFHF